MIKATMYVLGICIVLGFQSRAQECDSKLEEARRSYYNGNFSEVISHLEGCVEKMSGTEARIEAYSLMSQSAIMMENDSLASTYAFLSLQEDPFYKPGPATLREYQEIHQQFEIRNYLNLGFAVGFNKPSFSILDYHSYASVTTEPQQYETFTSLNFNIWGGYYLLYNFYLKAGFGFQQHEFFQEEIIFDYQSVSSRETYQYLTIPVQMEYQFNRWPLKPFVNAGMSYHILNSAKGDIVNSPIEGGIPNPFAGVTRSLDAYDLAFQRTSGSWNMLLGGGLRYRFNQWMMEVSVYYENGESNLVNEVERYSDPVLLDHSYVPDDFKMRQLNVNLGLVYSFLKPTERIQ